MNSSNVDNQCESSRAVFNNSTSRHKISINDNKIAPIMVQLVTPHRTGTNLRLYPWRDGYRATRKLLEMEANHVKTVHVLLEEAPFQHVLSDMDAVALFAAIGRKLPKLESVIVELKISPDVPRVSVATPPIEALTSLLMNKRIQSVTWIGLRLLGDHYHMRCLVEAIRMHSTLHSVVIRKCWFASDKHLQLLKRTLKKRGYMKHVDLKESIIVELPSRKPSKEPEKQATWSCWESFDWCQSITCCM
jgi:hypothetical protein